MIVALNVGNSNVGYGIVRDGQITTTGHAPTPIADVQMQLEMILDEALGHSPAADDANTQLVVASVVPVLTQAVREIAARRGYALLEADQTTLGMPGGGAATAGNDRLVNAFAAANLHGTPAIVVDLGTATTFDVVDSSGAFLGGAIAPGVGLGLDALASRTAQLPRVPMVLPAHALGRTTVEAIQSGSVLGHVGMVSYLIRAIGAELATAGQPQPKVVLTGGLSAHPWAKAIPGVDVIDPLLTLRGLALLSTQRQGVESVASA